MFIYLGIDATQHHFFVMQNLVLYCPFLVEGRLPVASTLFLIR